MGLLSLVTVLVGLSLAQQQPFVIAQDLAASRAKESAVRKQLVADFRQHTTSLNDDTVQNYLDRLGNQLAVHLRDPSITFEFNAIADDPCRSIHEPVNLPGGYVFVPAAMFLAALDEAEFAGMLAHAMQHVALREGVGQAARGQIATFGTVPLVLSGGRGPGCSEEPTPLGFLALQRSSELEADRLAVEMVAEAGIDPKGLSRYIERVQSRRSGTLSPAYSWLPDRDQRLTALSAAIDKLPPVVSRTGASDQFAAVQREVRRRLQEWSVRSGRPPSLVRKRPGNGTADAPDVKKQ